MQYVQITIQFILGTSTFGTHRKVKFKLRRMYGKIKNKPD